VPVQGTFEEIMGEAGLGSEDGGQPRSPSSGRSSQESGWSTTVHRSRDREHPRSA